MENESNFRVEEAAQTNRDEKKTESSWIRSRRSYARTCRFASCEFARGWLAGEIYDRVIGRRAGSSGNGRPVRRRLKSEATAAHALVIREWIRCKRVWTMGRITVDHSALPIMMKKFLINYVRKRNRYTRRHSKVLKFFVFATVSDTSEILKLSDTFE